MRFIAAFVLLRGWDAQPGGDPEHQRRPRAHRNYLQSTNGGTGGIDHWRIPNHYNGDDPGEQSATSQPRRPNGA